MLENRDTGQLDIERLDIGQGERPESPTRSRVRDRSGDSEDKGNKPGSGRKVRLSEENEAGDAKGAKGSKKAKESDGVKPRKTRHPLRSLLIAVLILLFLILAIAGGMVFGYVMLGKQPMHDVLEWSTWKHVYDLVFAP